MRDIAMRMVIDWSEKLNLYDVRAPDTSSAGVTFMGVIWPWFMPLLFLLAGIAAWYALQKRDAGHFLKECMISLLRIHLGIMKREK